MASGEQLIRLFKSFKENDQVEFSKIAYDIIEEEKRKNHNLLATKLYRIMFDNNFTLNFKKTNLNKQKQIPTDKDSGVELLEIKYTRILLDHIILSNTNKKKIINIMAEFQNKDLLLTYKLYPKNKLLFCGPPGCGKTITAEALANELQIPLLYTRFDSIVSSFLGETASNLRKVFDFSRNGEWILFFDEFDAIAKSREDINEHSELKRVVNSFLQLMDDFNKDTIIIAATNYETLIDKALWRRFDEVIFFDKPNKSQIKEIIKLNLKSYNYSKVDINKYIDKLIGLSYSDIERICVESIKSMILSKSKVIDDRIFESVINDELDRKKLIENRG